MVDPVATNPIFEVTEANADNKVNGSKEVGVALLFKASIGIFNRARWSAMKNASNFALSRY